MSLKLSTSSLSARLSVERTYDQANPMTSLWHHQAYSHSVPPESRATEQETLFDSLHRMSQTIPPVLTLRLWRFFAFPSPSDSKLKPVEIQKRFIHKNNIRLWDTVEKKQLINDSWPFTSGINSLLVLKNFSMLICIFTPSILVVIFYLFFFFFTSLYLSDSYNCYITWIKMNIW